jgi:hypothetical protein
VGTYHNDSLAHALYLVSGVLGLAAVWLWARPWLRRVRIRSPLTIMSDPAVAPLNDPARARRLVVALGAIRTEQTYMSVSYADEGFHALAHKLEALFREGGWRTSITDRPFNSPSEGATEVSGRDPELVGRVAVALGNAGFSGVGVLFQRGDPRPTDTGNRITITLGYSRT